MPESSIDFATRRRYYNLCDPGEPLPPEDDRNVDIDRMAGGSVRAAQLFEGLATDFELSDTPLCKLFSGLPGSGKSTELRRLAKHLADPEGLRLLPVIVNAEELLNINVEIDVPDVLMAILYAVEAKVLETAGLGREPMRDGYFKRLWHYLTTTEVEFKQAQFTVAEGVDLVAELKTREPLRKKVRETIGRNLNGFIRDVRAELSKLEDQVRKLPTDGRPYGGLVIIVDSLEKLAGTASTWHPVMNSAELFFRAQSPWLDMPVHIIYTVPPALMTRIPGIEFMPMIKVRTREGQPFPAGIEAVRAMIEHRVPRAELPKVFGEQFEARVASLIQWSGGYPRELVRLLRQCFRYRSYPLDDAEFERVFDEVIANYRRQVLLEDIPWLIEVSRTRWVTFETTEHQASADRMLSINAIMYYPNGQGFYDLHPALYRIPPIQAALANDEPADAEG
ncbi:MAG: hypothetical protein KC431_23035 [Myxococcales bacterium]|nr:hypothetical protein [Myxococcales bacterium]MCA9700421.1 hypothetical protein [Myxococcales bacterium]